MSEEIKVSNMFIDSLKTQEEIYSKAKIKELYEAKIKDLQQKVEQLENIRKEAIEFILKGRYGEDNDLESISIYVPDLLNILNKGDNKE